MSGALVVAGLGVAGTDRQSAAGVTVTALAVDPRDPERVYAGTLECGVFKSIDGGGRWRSASRGLYPDPAAIYPSSVSAVVIDPRATTTVYAATDGNGLYKSTDGGRRWHPRTRSAGFRSYYANALVIDPRRPRTLYAATTVHAVLKTTNAAATWRVTRKGLPRGEVAGLALAIDPRHPAVLYLGTYEGVYRSSDGGQTWLASRRGLAMGRHVDRSLAYWTTWSLVVDPHAPATIYASTAEAGIFKSTNGGRRWRAVGVVRDVEGSSALAMDPRTPGTVYAAHFLDVLKSTDGGRSWAKMNSGLREGYRRAGYVEALAINPQDTMTVYAGIAGGGVFKTVDGGEHWRAVSVGLPAGDAAC